MTKNVIYWEKVPKLKKAKGNRQTIFELVPVKGVVVGDSIPVCGLCREAEQSHQRSRRRHPFAYPIGGLTLDVTHVNGKTAQYDNVQPGKEANCWTEEK